MNKSVIFSLFLMASLLMGTSLNMNMFSTAMASEKDRDDHDNRNHYDDDKRNQESTYNQDRYASSYDQSYGYDAEPYYSPQQPSYDQKPSYSYSQSSSSDYSDYKTNDKKYECRTGPFEGFFVSSVEFCKHIKFDDRKDHKDNRDNRTGQQGPPGPPGPAGPQGPAGPSTINTTNIYTNVGNTTTGTINGGTLITSIAFCDAGDTALSGSFDINGTAEIRTFEPLATENGWNATALVTGNAGGGGNTGSVTADVVCFDNPPPHIP